MADFTEANAITDSFKIKGKITGQTGNNGTRSIKIMIPLKYSSKFWRTLEMPLSNCEIKLDLNWFENCVIVGNADQATAFSITDKKKLYFPDVILSTQNNAKLLEQLIFGFKRTINWININQKYQQKDKVNI